MTLKGLIRRQPEISDPWIEFPRMWDTLFDDVRNRWPAFRADVSGEFVPRLDIAEDEKGFEVTVELPGMEAKDVELSLHEGMLTIKGKKETEHAEHHKNVFRSERTYGSFQRQVALPMEIDTERINAMFKNGVLTVHLTKTPEALRAARKIAIRTE